MGSVKESSSEYTSDNTSQLSDTSSNISLDIAEKSKKKIIIKIPHKNDKKPSTTKGKKASEIWEYSHEIMKSEGVFHPIPKGTMIGHSIGLNVHEEPMILKNI